MKLLGILGAVLITLLMPISPAFAQPARDYFGAVHQPSSGPEQVIGSYAKGCIGGAVQLPTDGPGWQAMRLSRDRRWGSAELVQYIQALGQAVAQDGLPGILVGDMGQARGGPMASGHASHQIGLDVDIWLQPCRTTCSAQMTGRTSLLCRFSRLVRVRLIRRCSAKRSAC